METLKSNNSEKVPVWPDLVYREFLAVLIAMLGLGIISMLFNAPLESVADPSFSTNPSKAPWYFLGLQELLVYFSPWVAGIAIPTLIILALMILPYLDKKTDRNGSAVFLWSFAISATFTLGLVLWVVLTLIGMEFRGPNWDWQLPFMTISGNEAPGITDLTWVYPLTIFIFLISAFLIRRRKIDQEIIQFGWFRLFIAYFTAGTLFLVTIKVTVYIVMDLFLKFGS
ncbi:MAG: hypothetical protein HOD92_10685 [Deltaproteobacteria bacterium]|jgi:hypothetical protein|nr:hypothetical protein [Deltaproteobacteria bacterium]MBT4526739.1 hypothetical protein [Deltaproteobacteria bacterium]